MLSLKLQATLSAESLTSVLQIITCLADSQASSHFISSINKFSTPYCRKSYLLRSLKLQATLSAESISSVSQKVAESEASSGCKKAVKRTRDADDKFTSLPSAYTKAFCEIVHSMICQQLVGNCALKHSWCKSLRNYIALWPSIIRWLLFIYSYRIQDWWKSGANSWHIFLCAYYHTTISWMHCE